MPQTNATADELIWYFHKELAGTKFCNVRIAIVPSEEGGWSALTNASERRHYPELADNIARIEARLRARYSLIEM